MSDVGDPLPWLGGLFPSDVRAIAARIEDHQDAIFPDEWPGLERATAKRRHEFSTGRWLARRLLDELGLPAAPIPRNSDRTPRWPPGWVGSITHSARLCAAAVAPASRIVGLGIDLEPDAPVKPGIERMVCFGDELAWIADAGPEELGRRCRLVFSAKEAVYKAFHPSTGRVWRFEEVALEIDLAAGSFLARLPGDAGSPSIEGRVLRREGWIVCGVARSADKADPRRETTP